MRLLHSHQPQVAGHIAADEVFGASDLFLLSLVFDQSPLHALGSLLHVSAVVPLIRLQPSQCQIPDASRQFIQEAAIVGHHDQAAFPAAEDGLQNDRPRAGPGVPAIWPGYVQAGAGVVADSDPTYEFNETVNKAKGMLRANEHNGGIFLSPEDKFAGEPKSAETFPASQGHERD